MSGRVLISPTPTEPSMDIDERPIRYDNSLSRCSKEDSKILHRFLNLYHHVYSHQAFGFQNRFAAISTQQDKLLSTGMSNRQPVDPRTLGSTDPGPSGTLPSGSAAGTSSGTRSGTLLSGGPVPVLRSPSTQDDPFALDPAGQKRPRSPTGSTPAKRKTARIDLTSPTKLAEDISELSCAPDSYIGERSFGPCFAASSESLEADLAVG